MPEEIHLNEDEEKALDEAWKTLSSDGGDKPVGKPTVTNLRKKYGRKNLKKKQGRK